MSNKTASAAAPATTVRKERVDEVNLVRAFAILGVLSVHATSFATIDMKLSSYYYLYNFANIFFKFGTPTFILLSSFVLFYNYYEQPVSKSLIAGFYKKRLLYILLPYLIFSAGYYWMLHVVYYTHREPLEALWIFVQRLLTGKAYTHLYFVFISVQFYLLFPLLLVAFKSRRWLAKYAILIGFAVQWGFVLANHWSSIHLQWSVPNKGSWAFSYFAYYMTGAFLGIYWDKVKRWLLIRKEDLRSRFGAAAVIIWTLWLGFGLAHVQLWHYTRVNSKYVYSLWYEWLWNMHTFLSALVLFQLSCFVLRYGPRWLARLLTHLGIVSFGIYLIHPLFLLVYRQFPVTAAFWSHIWYAGGFVLALGASWLIVTLFFRWIPGAWIFFGNVPSAYRGRPRRKPDKPAAVPPSV